MTNLAALGGDERTDGPDPGVLVAPAGANENTPPSREKKSAGFAPRVVEIALLIVVALLLARMAMQLFAPLPTPTGEPVFADNAANAGAQAGPLVVKNPFPAVVLDEAPVETVAATEEIAETSLNLTLTGVNVYDEDPSAIIRTEDGKDKRFVVGDDVAPGVKLDAVQANQVILLRNGVREALKFENKVLPETKAPPARRQRTQAPQQQPAQSANPGAIASVSLGPLSSVVRPAPAETAGGAPAVALYPSANRRLFTELGFQEGDLLVSINGQSAIDNAPRLTALVGQFVRSGGGRLIVERDGEEVTIPIDLDLLRGRL